MDWLLVLALNFSDGGTQTTYVPVATKEACATAMKAGVAASMQVATAPFKFSGTCINQKTGEIVNPLPDGILGPQRPRPTPQGHSVSRT